MSADVPVDLVCIMGIIAPSVGNGSKIKDANLHFALKGGRAIVKHPSKIPPIAPKIYFLDNVWDACD